MDEAVDVEKVNACDRLNEEVKCFILCELTQALSVADDVKQVALLHILQDQVDVVLVLERRVQTHDVLVLQFFVDLDFTAQSCVYLRRCD